MIEFRSSSKNCVETSRTLFKCISSISRFDVVDNVVQNDVPLLPRPEPYSVYEKNQKKKNR